MDVKQTEQKVWNWFETFVRNNPNAAFVVALVLGVLIGTVL